MFGDVLRVAKQIIRLRIALVSSPLGLSTLHLGQARVDPRFRQAHGGVQVHHFWIVPFLVRQIVFVVVRPVKP